MKKHLLALFVLAILPAAIAFAQEEKRLQDYLPEPPQLFGAVKAKFETSLYDGIHRFNVRNSRIGLRGAVSPNMKYGAQIDFSNEGKLTVLDMYVSLLRNNAEADQPRNSLNITLGQQQLNFSSDMDRGPSSNLFANRSFLAKFLTTYYRADDDGEFVTSLGSRDIGAQADWGLHSVPVRFIGGIFNGSGVNNPEWSNTINLVGKVEIGRSEGFFFAASHYNGKTATEGVQLVGIDAVRPATKTQRIRMWGGELRYLGPKEGKYEENDNKYGIYAEYGQRRINDGRLHLLSSAYVQGYYKFDLPYKTSMFDYVAPVVRWDIADNVEFKNKATNNVDRFSAQRATIGVNLGFVGKLVNSEIRLNGEKFFFDGGKPSDYAQNPLLQDKITIEIVASF